MAKKTLNSIFRIALILAGMAASMAFSMFWTVWLDMVAASTGAGLGNPVSFFGGEKGGILFIPPLFALCIFILFKGVYPLVAPITEKKPQVKMEPKKLKRLVALILAFLLFFVSFEILANIQMGRIMADPSINEGMKQQMRLLCGFDKGPFALKAMSYIVDKGDVNAFLAVNKLGYFHVWRIPVADPADIVCIR